MEHSFYKKRRRWFENQYKHIDADRLYSCNGFTAYPNTIYNYFIPLININSKKSELKIIDFFCGNGLLLKHLIINTTQNIIPFGVDFIDGSIQYAKSLIHIRYHENFICSNAVTFNFNNAPYNIALIDPSLLSSDDFLVFLRKCLETTTDRIIFYCYSDVLDILGHCSIADFQYFDDFKITVIDYPEISLAYLDL